MPVNLDRCDWARWLGVEPATPEALLGMLRPCPPERMRAYPIAPRVNSVKNDDPGLIDPLMAEGGIAV